MRSVIAGLVALALLGAAPLARADDDAATLIDKGLDLRQARRDAEALLLFEKAQALSPTPRGEAQVALAEQALGRWVAAERDLRGALEAKGDAWIESKRTILERALGVIREHLGDVLLSGPREGEVYVDGALVSGPDAHTHLRLEVGRRTIEVRAPGKYTYSRTVEVRPDDTVRLEVALQPLLAEPVLAPPPESPARHAPASAPPSASGLRTAGWIVLAGAVVGLGVGAGGVIDRQTAAGEFNGDSSCTGTASSELSATCRGWLSDGQTGQTLAIAGFISGGVLAGVAAALLLWPSGAAHKGSALVCVPARAGGSCGLAGTF